MLAGVQALSRAAADALPSFLLKQHTIHRGAMAPVEPSLPPLRGWRAEASGIAVAPPAAASSSATAADAAAGAGGGAVSFGGASSSSSSGEIGEVNTEL